MAIIWQLSIVRFTDKTLVQGVVTGQLPYSLGVKSSTLTYLVKVIGSYFIKRYSNKEISLHTQKQLYQIKTNSYGGFELLIDEPYNDKCLFRKIDDNQILSVNQDYPIVFEDVESDLSVISDIDDTLIISYTSSFWKRIATLLFRKPDLRKVISFTHQILDYLEKSPSRIFYISKSESNLFGILSYFLTHNNLPKGVLFLTPYLAFHQLVKKKDGLNFKHNTISRIVKNSGYKKYILLGDDTQQDLSIYHTIATENEEKIVGIYIRQTKNDITAYHKSLIKALQNEGVFVQFFKELETPDLDQLSRLTASPRTKDKL